MEYKNSEMKVDQLVSYLNEKKINLSPAFQRGRVWKIGARRKLLRNMVQGKPIPAVFLYKEASGSKYSYNILDGKQRLESLILFIGSKREDLKIPAWSQYFFLAQDRKAVHYPIDFEGGSKCIHQLDDDVIRDFREYAIPTIEISLDEDSSLDEVISLFVDINQQGIPVNRFDIVKAMCKGEPILKGVFGLLAIEQRRRQDVFYRMIANDFTGVLKKLQIIDRIAPSNAKVDRMWEKLLEIALFHRRRVHRKPVEILKGFIGQSGEKSEGLRAREVRSLRLVFRFLKQSYRDSALGKTKLATDQTHFYTMITAIIRNELLGVYTVAKLRKRLAKFGKMLDSGRASNKRRLNNLVKKYLDLSTKQTTDVSRRNEREKVFITILDIIE